MLKAFGLDDLEELLYLALVDAPSQSADELARLAGATPDQVTRILDGLVSAGLITRLPGAPRQYCAIEPSIGFTGLVADRDERARRAQEQAQRARVTAHQLAERFRLRRARHPDDLIEVVAGAEAIRERVFQLERMVRTEMRGIDVPPYVDPANQPVFELLGKGTQVRFLYDRSVLDMPGKLDEIARFRAAGEEGRVLAGVPFKLIIADDRLALIVLSESYGGVTSALAIGPSTLLEGLSRMFETLWRFATPLQPTGSHPGADPPSPEDSQLLALLASGMTDKTIARRLGVNIRTAQRRVQQLMERLGADTRFQAGLQAKSRGWL